MRNATRFAFMGYVYSKTDLRVQILGYWKQKKNLAFEKTLEM